MEYGAVSLEVCANGISFRIYIVEAPIQIFGPPVFLGVVGGPPHLGATGLLSQGVQARRKALRTRHINGMEVRKKRPRGFKKRPRGFK